MNFFQIRSTYLCWLIIFTALALNMSTAYADDFRISGFARLIAGKTLDQQVTYEGFDDSWSFNDQSLIAIQPEYQINDNLSVTTQFLYTENPEVGSEVEWAYFTYQASPNWQLRAGKLRTPFLSLSDVIHVGYTYHWVQVPNEVNAEFLFSSFEGFDAIYSVNNEKYALDLQGYYGKHDDKLRTDNRFDIDTDVSNFWGLVATFRLEHYTFRTSYHQLQVKLTGTPADQLRDIMGELGFSKTQEALNIDDIMNLYQASVNYERLSHFMKLETIYFNSDEPLTHSLFSAYLSAGYRWDTLTIHATAAMRRDYLVDFINDEIPNDTPANIALRELVEVALDDPPYYDVRSLALGFRWDLVENWAFKGEVKKLFSPSDRLGAYNTTPVNFGNEFDGNSTVLTFALEWVF
ncbi:hypothetical protein [Flocculibacter collagenilyticus]|uniref:hypothetical protein n=1 Tax=Flocculibacter collagenilyticus TaxID=2744479 RepID=UPI0018F3DBA1|nr:hypothetical protein [Flocculibacter collagenilyticus]